MTKPLTDYSTPWLYSFTVTAQTAARSLGVVPDTLIDLARAALIPFVVLPPWMCPDRPTLRFNADNLAELARTRETHTADRRTEELIAVSTALRRYLATHLARADYDVAMEYGAPLLQTSRSRVVYVHVRAEVIRRRLREEATASGVPSTVLPSEVGPALERLGCVPGRGRRSAGETRQRGHLWYRVPLSIFDPAGQQHDPLVDAPLFGGAPLNDTEEVAPGQVPPSVAQWLGGGERSRERRGGAQ